MSVTLPERALLVKLFYENKGNAAAALREFRRLKNLRKATLLPQDLRRMIARFEKTGHLGVQPGRGRKSTRSDVVEDVATAIVEQSMDNVVGCSSAREVSRHLSLQYSAERTQKNGAFFSRTRLVTISTCWPSTEKTASFLARVEVDACGHGSRFTIDDESAFPSKWNSQHA
ncbi:hypothetical protein AVEN_99134-1 [Araneus ventricosus]|uniref:Uncharacterized protein n=1 Tax=Araneus ventricosus TaxID=182803 RepID=A0A4Y2QQ10_ARAVE|nr:hypothetical protein AVEN_99134-1 [Araneus ventricosus]